MDINNTFITNIYIDINKLSIDEIMEYKSFYGKLPENKFVYICLPDWFINFINKKHIKYFSKDKMIIHSKYLKQYVNTFTYLNKIAIIYLLKDIEQIRLYITEENELKKCITTDISNQSNYYNKIKSEIKDFDNKVIIPFIFHNILKLNGDINLINIEYHNNLPLIKHISWFISNNCNYQILTKIIESQNKQNNTDNIFNLFIREYCEYLYKDIFADYYFIHYEGNKFDGTTIKGKNNLPQKIRNGINNLNSRKEAKTIVFENITWEYFTRLQNGKNRIGIIITISKLLNYDNNISFIYKLSYAK